MVVNYDHINIILDQQVNIHGEHDVNTDHTVDVEGDVEYKTSINQLRVQFGTITGSFVRNRSTPQDPRLNSLVGFPRKVEGSVSVARSRIRDLTHAPNQVEGHFWAYHCAQLQSLHGAPRWVGGNFVAYNCALTSLKGAPLVVKGLFEVSGNPLENYDHIPEGCVSVKLPYNKSAPILRLLVYPEVTFTWDGVTTQAHPFVDEVMRKYAGQGRAGAIRAAAELVKAGYKENARW
jgi:hypothetical protein